VKYVLAQIAFKLPDSFDIKKGDLNTALEEVIIYRMTRHKLCKSKKVKPRMAKDWTPIKDLFLQLWDETGKSDRRLAANFGFGQCADPPKKAAKKPRSR
jgi:hypothetical protein